MYSSSIHRAQRKRKWLTEEIHRLFTEDEAVIEVTDHPGHAKQLARQYASEGTMLRIYACGGDGTLHEVVNGVLGFRMCRLPSFRSGPAIISSRPFLLPPHRIFSV
ncbi:MAG: acylglycerol kinase family protein [Merdibacter sp.]